MATKQNRCGKKYAWRLPWPSQRAHQYVLCHVIDPWIENNLKINRHRNKLVKCVRYRSENKNAMWAVIKNFQRTRIDWFFLCVRILGNFTFLLATNRWINKWFEKRFPLYRKWRFDQHFHILTKKHVASHIHQIQNFETYKRKEIHKVERK